MNKLHYIIFSLLFLSLSADALGMHEQPFIVGDSFAESENLATEGKVSKSARRKARRKKKNQVVARPKKNGKKSNGQNNQVTTSSAPNSPIKDREESKKGSSSAPVSPTKNSPQDTSSDEDIDDSSIKFGPNFNFNPTSLFQDEAPVIADNLPTALLEIEQEKVEEERKEDAGIVAVIDYIDRENAASVKDMVTEALHSVIEVAATLPESANDLGSTSKEGREEPASQDRADEVDESNNSLSTNDVAEEIIEEKFVAEEVEEDASYSKEEAKFSDSDSSSSDSEDYQSADDELPENTSETNVFKQRKGQDDQSGELSSDTVETVIMNEIEDSNAGDGAPTEVTILSEDEDEDNGFPDDEESCVEDRRSSLSDSELCESRKRKIAKQLISGITDIEESSVKSEFEEKNQDQEKDLTDSSSSDEEEGVVPSSARAPVRAGSNDEESDSSSSSDSETEDEDGDGLDARSPVNVGFAGAKKVESSSSNNNDSNREGLSRTGLDQNPASDDNNENPVIRTKKSRSKIKAAVLAVTGFGIVGALVYKLLKDSPMFCKRTNQE